MIAIETLIIYDGTGKIIMTSTNTENYKDISSITVEVPECKIPASVDILSKTPIYNDRPKTELELLKEQVDAQAEAILALMDDNNS